VVIPQPPTHDPHTNTNVPSSAHSHQQLKPCRSPGTASASAHPTPTVQTPPPIGDSLRQRIAYAYNPYLVARRGQPTTSAYRHQQPKPRRPSGTASVSAHPTPTAQTPPPVGDSFRQRIVHADSPILAARRGQPLPAHSRTNSPNPATRRGQLPPAHSSCQRVTPPPLAGDSLRQRIAHASGSIPRRPSGTVSA
jgi:hypothetical protein